MLTFQKNNPLILMGIKIAGIPAIFLSGIALKKHKKFLTEQPHFF
jgi:hypothetical protein